MHQRATKLRQRARSALHWPGMDKEITEAAQSCTSCTEILPSNPAEPNTTINLTTEVAAHVSSMYVFHEVSVDDVYILISSSKSKSSSLDLGPVSEPCLAANLDLD
jgi:Integrase zinc binding domain